MLSRPRSLSLLLTILFLIFAGENCDLAAQTLKIKTDLDPFVTLPSAWAMTPDKLDESFSIEKARKNPVFKWLTKKRTRALFSRRPFADVINDLTIFGGQVPVEEAIVDFEDGKLLGVTISIMNRGDTTARYPAEFKRRFKVAGEQIGSQLEIRPFRREANPTQGALTEGWIWISAKGMAVLEHNPEAPGTIEFLRMRLARRDAKGVYAAAMDKRAGAAFKLSDLPRNVTRDDDGNVFIENIPMVDQGQKGYCVVASAQRLFEYYGIPCDQHQLAQIAEADPNRGTNPLVVREELGKIDHRFKTRFETVALASRSGLREVTRQDTYGNPVDQDDFWKAIADNVDDGIPLLWGLEVGMFPEVPAIPRQASGGHMRMIIGYNEEKQRVIFTDSWGAGHEFKSMAAGDAYKASHGLFLLQPITR